MLRYAGSNLDPDASGMYLVKEANLNSIDSRNDTKDVKEALRGAQIYGAGVWLLYFGLAGAAGWLALRPPLFLQELVAAYSPL